MKVAVADIIIGDRLREDMGDIAGLAQSIADYGLFYPIIVTSDLRLVCGHRRMEAAKRIGMVEIEATVWEDLDDETRREIEREENERRKPLTDFERSKRLVTRAKEEAPVVAAKIAERAISAESAENSKKLSDGRGRPSRYEAPRSEVAKALGIGETTLREAEQHVSAVESFPELEHAPQATAIEAAKRLRDVGPTVVERAREIADQYPWMSAWPEYRALEARMQLERLPEADREAAIALVNRPYCPPDDATKILRNLASMPPDARAKVFRDAQSDDQRYASLALSVAAGVPPQPDPRIFLIDDAIRPLRKAQAGFPDDPLAARFGGAIDGLLDLRRAVKEAWTIEAAEQRG